MLDNSSLLYNMISEEALSSMKRSHESNGNQSLYVGCHNETLSCHWYQNNERTEKSPQSSFITWYGRHLVLGGLVINIDESRHKLTSPVGSRPCRGGWGEWFDTSLALVVLSTLRLLPAEETDPLFTSSTKVSWEDWSCNNWKVNHHHK